MKIDLASLDFHEAHRFLAEALSPRLVTLISTVGSDGAYNVAPFASTGIICYKPAILYIGISSRNGQKKDTLNNIEFSGDFVLNVVDESLAEPMNKSAAYYPPEVDEFQVCALTAAPGEKVKSPRVMKSPVSLECKVKEVLRFGEDPHIRHVVFGEVLLAHIRNNLFKDGRIDISMKKAIAHFTGGFYCRTTDIFEIKRI